MEHAARPVVLVLTGPTATGKTAAAVQLCRLAGGEVVTADSMQVYRGMDIGTAKPTAAERGGVAHHLIDLAGPDETFSVSRYVQAGIPCVDALLARGVLPVIAGGTGLYIDALLAGRAFAACPGDGALRQALSDEYDAVGGAAFRERLRAVDPERAERLAPADKKRLVRAMEVFRLTGRTITEHDRETALLPPRYPALKFALTFEDRDTLYRRIDLRAARMVEDGLFDEVQALLDRGVTPDCTAMQGIGYKEAAEALLGRCTRQQALEQIQLASRRYAKRQLTWLRRDADVRWLAMDHRTPAQAAQELLHAWQAAQAG
ncbi:MAG: tRNA (adenosine(37)-N6)-dimethylallyltransferase MiaA [Clostridiales bacterium]|nr:tRNA (adenosine(37)-N6)-dimethylallyltransferase MiaA [Clostridiales bacterium]